MMIFGVVKVLSCHQLFCGCPRLPLAVVSFRTFLASFWPVFFFAAALLLLFFPCLLYPSSYPSFFPLFEQEDAENERLLKEADLEDSDADSDLEVEGGGVGGTATTTTTTTIKTKTTSALAGMEIGYKEDGEEEGEGGMVELEDLGKVLPGAASSSTSASGSKVADLEAVGKTALLKSLTEDHSNGGVGDDGDEDEDKKEGEEEDSSGGKVDVRPVMVTPMQVRWFAMQEVETIDFQC
jgi:hypothetical protein